MKTPVKKNAAMLIYLPGKENPIVLKDLPKAEQLVMQTIRDHVGWSLARVPFLDTIEHAVFGEWKIDRCVAFCNDNGLLQECPPNYAASEKRRESLDRLPKKQHDAIYSRYVDAAVEEGRSLTLLDLAHYAMRPLVGNVVVLVGDHKVVRSLLRPVSKLAMIY